MRPPRAPRLPLLGNILDYSRDPLGFLCETRERYGDVVRVALGPQEIVLVSHPELVEDMLVTRNRLFRKDRFLRTTLRPVLGDGLLSSEGDFWRRQRRLAQPAFHRDRIAAYAEEMAKAASALVATYRDGESRDVHKDMMKLTLEIVAATLFGADVGADAERVGSAVESVLAVVSDPLPLFAPFVARLPTPQRRRFDRAVKDLDAIIYGVIELRRQSGVDGRDLLSMLLAARDEDGGRMSDRQLRDECMTLFLAGHETTALALSWTWALLSEHPDVRDELTREVDEVLGERTPEIGDVPKLVYTAQVVSEALRLYPPAWSMGREALEDLELAGFEISRGEQIWFCPWSIHHDARWFPEPKRFRPERWSQGGPRDLHRYAYFPFGGGPRFCIGQSFAQLEAILILAVMARRVRFDATLRPAPEPSVTLRPKGGLRVRVHRRRPQSTSK